MDYEIDPLTGSLNQLMRHDKKKFASNLSTLLRWSPFATEAELLKQVSLLIVIYLFVESHNIF